MRAFLLLATLFALLGSSCGGGGSESATPGETAPTPATPSPQAPAVEGVTLDGERLSLADLRGRPVFVNVWSSW